jgi:Flp pilus assembly protein protease CpaA
VRHDTTVEEPGGRSSSFESHQPSLDGAPASAAIDGGAATFDISFAVTTLVVVTTAAAAVLTSHDVPGAAWVEAAGASASACCGAYLLGALGAGDGPEERRRAAGWMAFAGLALGALLVLEFMREFFTA